MSLAALRRLGDPDTRPIALATLLLLAALALPELPWPRASYDYLVVFDITQSMDVPDQHEGQRPASRLDAARRALREALPALPCGSKLGLGVFTEYRSVLLLAPVEVCANYDDLLATLANVDGRMRWAEASEVAKGLFWGLRAARDIGGKPDLVFVTDGHEAPPLDGPGPAVFDDIRPGEVGGWILGVGEAAPSPIPRTDASGRRRGYWSADEVVQSSAASREHLSSLHEAHLRELAGQVGLGYRRLDRASNLAEAMLDASHARRRQVATDLAWAPVGLALAVLAWRFRAGPAARRRTPAAGGPQGLVPRDIPGQLRARNDR